MEFHPLAEMFPLMQGDAFSQLVEDIKSNGQQEPVVLYQGKILDGRNRWRACQQLGIECTFTEFTGDDPSAYVVSLNLKRRHLSDSQRAIIAGRLTDVPPGPYRFFAKKAVEKGMPAAKTTTAQEAAAMFDISKDAVWSAKKILKQGTPEEIAAVERGELAVTTLADHIRMGLDPKEREEIRNTPKHKRGRKPEQYTRQKLNGQIWAQLRDALYLLSGMPDPSEVVAIARANDRKNTVETRLPIAVKWLQEFNDARNSDSNEAA